MSEELYTHEDDDLEILSSERICGNCRFWDRSEAMVVPVYDRNGIRRGAAGLPFFFIRVDRAGNISKRHSATDFHFSQVGGSCPLWIIYEAFNQPGRILTQVARMPDGRRHFWLARQVSSGPVGHGQPRKTFAVALGCELQHADRLVYARGLDTQNPSNAVPIGPGCRVCPREDCMQRAFAALPGKS